MSLINIQVTELENKGKKLRYHISKMIQADYPTHPWNQKWTRTEMKRNRYKLSNSENPAKK